MDLGNIKDMVHMELKEQIMHLSVQIFELGEQNWKLDDFFAFPVFGQMTNKNFDAAHAGVKSVLYSIKNHPNGYQNQREKNTPQRNTPF